MNKFTLLASAIALAITSNQVSAEQITGKVTSEQGKALDNVLVKVMGTNNSVKTDENGDFSLKVKPGEYELHITAKSYVHKNLDVVVVKSDNPNVAISLDKSAIEIIDKDGKITHIQAVKNKKCVHEFKKLIK